MSATTDTYKYSDIKIDSGVSHFDPKLIKIDDLYRHCIASHDQTQRIKIAGSPDHDLKNDARLYKAERKLIEHVVKERVLGERVLGKADKNIIPINEARLLIPLDNPISAVSRTSLANDEEDAVTEKMPAAEQYLSALVVSWNGRGAPPENLNVRTASKIDGFKLPEPLDETPFQRVWNHRKDSTSTKLRFHWTKVILFSRLDDLDKPGTLQSLWNQLREELKTSEFTLHHVPCKFRTEELTLRDALMQVQWAKGSNYMDEKYWYDVVHAILKSEYKTHNDFAVHGLKFFDLRAEKENKKLGGVQHCVGKHREMFLNGVDDPILQEDPCPKLFFTPDTVANFMVEYFSKGDPVGALRHVNHESLQAALRGKLVHFKIDGKEVTKSIQAVSATNGADASDDQKHPRWRGKIGLTLKYPDLPCINIGTQYRQALLPPEMAKIVPGQTFKRPFTPALQQQLAEIREQNPDNMLKELRIGQIGVRVRLAPQTRELSVQQLFQECELNKADVTFIAAGVEGLDTSLWKQFRRQLRKVLSPDHQHLAKDLQPIFLPYTPGKDGSKLWEHQLRANKGQSRKDYDPVAVVVLRDDEHHSHLYKTIKTLCDTKVGLQTFMMKKNLLEQKRAKVQDDALAAEMAAKIIAKKIALRNHPKLSPAKDNAPLDISIALHIQQVTVNVPKVDPNDGKCILGTEAAKSVYVMVLSSRNTETSGNYCTTVKLVGPRKIHGLFVKESVDGFIDEIVKKVRPDVQHDVEHRVTFLRSGYIPQTVPEGDLQQGRRLPDSKVEKTWLPTNMNDKSIYSVDGEDSEPTRAKPKVPSMNETINNEISTLTTTTKARLGNKTSVSYVLISENKNYKFSERAKEAMEEAAKTMVEREKSLSQNVKESFFITDTAFNPSKDTIGAHRKVHVKDNASLVTLTLLGEELCNADDPDPEETEIPQDEPNPTPTKEHGNRQARLDRSGSGIGSNSPGHPFRVRSDPQPHSPRLPLSPRDINRISANNSPNISSLLSGTGRTASPRSMNSEPNRRDSHDKENTNYYEYDDEVLEKSPTPKNLLVLPKRRQQEPESPPSNINNAELLRLAKLWYDQRLGLDKTKLPIPTHLAYLAAKRALLHMRFDDYDKKDDDDDAAPCVLDPVHKDVQDTLYFL